MDRKSLILLTGLLLGLLTWLYLDVSGPVEVDYEWHSYLKDPTSGERRRPADVIDLDKALLNPSEDYVNKTSTLDRLFDMAQPINFLAVFRTAQIYSNRWQLEQSGWPATNQSACGRELDWIREKLGSTPGRHLTLDGPVGRDLANLLDTFGKPEPGLYSGDALTWPGKYEQCKRARLDGGRLGLGRYCLALMQHINWTSRAESSFQKTGFRVAVCLPETCDTLSFEAQRSKIDALIKFELNDYWRENLVLESMLCLPDERSPVRKLTTGGWVFTGIIAGWLTIVAIASIITKRKRHQHGPSEDTGGKQNQGLSNGIFKPARPAESIVPREVESPLRSHLRAISIQNSWTWFKSKPAHKEGQEVRVHLAVFDFVKCLMAVVVVFGHSFMLVSVMATSLSHATQLNRNPVFFLLANIQKFVDVFFLLFGALSTYTLLNKFTEKQLAQPLTWIMVNFKNFIRISIIYTLVYWYSRLIEPYTGEGPWWDYGVFKYSLQGICMREPWWLSILYFSNLGEIQQSGCVPVGWFLVALSQISLVVPLMSYVIHKLPNQMSRLLLMAFVTLISSSQLLIKMQRQISVKEQAFGTHGAYLMVILERYENMGLRNALGRLSCVAYGCYLGHLIYLYESGTIQKWPRWLTSKLTLTLTLLGHIAVLLVPLAGMIFLRHTHHVTSVNEFIGGTVATMILWPLLNSLLLLNLVTVYNQSPLVKSMSHPFWRQANKLSLCLYLVHWDVIVYLLTSNQDAASKGTFTDVFQVGSLALIISLVWSLPIVILIDTPISVLITRLVERRFRIGAHNARLQ